MDGVVNIDKPAGMTSRNVVDRVRKVLRVRRAGHAGTLDPLATGVLVVCVGRATRLVEYLQQLPKTYRAAFRLGQHSDTDDIEGNVETLCHPPIPTRDELVEATHQLVGTIQQIPPAFSAIRVGGERAYRRARRGEVVSLQPRPVVVESITVDRYDYPEVEMTITCHSGTYIRAIGRDLARSLGTAAVMTGLRRTCIGEFSVEHAVAPDVDPVEMRRAVEPPRAAVAHLPQVELDEADLQRVRQGQFIDSIELDGRCAMAVGLDAHGKLAAILQREPYGWRPCKVFLEPVTKRPPGPHTRGREG